jgi:hypothetical protein
MDAARSRRETARFSHVPAWQWARNLFRAHRFKDRRFGSLHFRICAAAFAINGVASSSAMRPGGRQLDFWAAINDIVSRAPAL